MEGTIIPSFVIRMFKIGESTGEIAKSLDNVVTFYTREIDNLSDNLIASIKPAGILIAGGMIIWIITATILPIYTQFIGKMM
jgi:type IV pilus assembly protein PilC